MPSDDFTAPSFWDWRYEAGRTPWDFGGVPAILRAWLADHRHGGSVLIPGCGSAYEVAAFAAAGYEVTALDFSPAAVARARRRLGPALAGCVQLGDFFAWESAAPFDVIYERTFLCALPPDRWPRCTARMAELLRPGGALVGHYFFGAKDDGPPFGLAPGEERTLFDRHFQLRDDRPSPDPLPLFAGRERWQERRKPGGPGEGDGK